MKVTKIKRNAATSQKPQPRKKAATILKTVTINNGFVSFSRILKIMLVKSVVIYLDFRKQSTCQLFKTYFNS